MHNEKLGKALIALLTISLSACSKGGGGSGPVGGNHEAHKFVIGKQIPDGPALKGSGTWTATKRECGDFHAVEVHDCIKVQVMGGKKQTVSVEADDNIADAIETRSEAGRLIISAKESFQATRMPEVVITTPELNEAYHAGTSDMIVTGVKGSVLNIDVTDSGTFYAAGRVTTERINLRGSGKVDTARLEADNAIVEVNGSGQCNLDVDKSLDAKVSGSGTIQYTGHPPSVRRSATGGGSIKEFRM